MKNPLIVFCLFCLLSLSVSAAVKTVTWTLPADWGSGVEYAEEGGRLVIRGGDFGSPSDPTGAPLLPFLNVSIAVPKDSVYSNCTVEATWTPLTVPSAPSLAALRPAVIQEPFVIGEDPVATDEDPRYFGAACYPSAPHECAGIQTGGETWEIHASVTPYRWNGQAGRLEKATSLKLTFTYDAPAVRRLALKSLSSSNYTGLFLIISPSQYANMWGNYLTYRRSTHPQIEFEVVNTADIYANASYKGRDDAQSIHKYLEYRYANRGGREMYVILGGGCKKDSDTYNSATMIPLRMTATRNRLYYPSDLYYACMEKPGNKGEVWDPNNDGIFLGYKNSSGYVSDTRAQVDIMPDIAVFRVPVRPSFTLDGKTVGAQAQIDGLVDKLRRAEAEDFAGRHNSGLAGLRVFADKSHGNTEDWMTQERTFYDGMVNVWSPSHASTVYDFEYFTRTAHRDWWFKNRPLKNFYASTENSPNAIPNNDMELYVIEAHGAPSGAGPLNNAQMWKSTHVQKVACWNLPCSTGKIDDDRLTVPEAMILNPNGGALVSYNNAREGYGIANNWDALSALMERENRRAYLANGLSNRTSGQAFIEGHRTFLNSVGGLQISATGIACYIETMAFGDPLVKLSDVTDNANLPATIGGTFHREATSYQKSLTVSSKSSVDKLTVRDLNGETFVVSGQEFKAYMGMAVYGGNVKWTAPGGVGGAGIAFDAKRDLEIAATGTTYFGPVFSNVGNLLVSGSNVTLDFDKTGKIRDLTSLRFTGAGPNYIRSREGGIFPASFTIPVSDGTLVLQTQNIGGGGAASDTTHPLFALTNATLRIDTNPNWGTEFLNRPVWMNNATLSSNYGKVGFGANVNNPPGFDVWVFGDKGSVIGGSQDVEVNGEFRVHCVDGARLAVNTPLVKAAKTGSLAKSGTGTLTLSAANTIAGGIRVREGKLVAGGVAGDVLGTGEVTVESGATLELTKLPLTTITRLTVKSGATLILPGAATTASYYLIDPTKGSVNLESGSTVVNVNATGTPLTGSMTGEGYYVDTSSFLSWADADGTWSTAAGDANWRNKSGASVAFANGDSVQFPDHGEKTRTVTVNGTLAPGYVNFNNHRTKYSFVRSGADSQISVNSVYTVGETAIAPDLRVNKLGVTGGRTIAGNVVSPEVFVSPGAALGITGTLSSQAYITKVTLQVTQMKGAYYNFSFLGQAGWHFAGYALGELELVNEDGRVLPPVGSVISASNGNRATVTGVSNGKITVSGTTAMANLFNGTAGSSSDRWGNIASENNDLKAKSATPTYTLTIEFSSPVKMISKYRFGLADYNLRNPENWKLSVVEKTSGGTYTVSTQSGVSLGGSNCYTGYYTCSSLGDSAGAGTLSVSGGAKLYLDGTLNVKPSVAAGATLAVTNRECLTLNKGWTLGGAVALDVGEADKMGWTKVLSGASLTAADVYKFALSTDSAVAKVQDGDLWVATEGIVEAPYTRKVGGVCDWNTADWFANGEKFTKTFGEVITRSNGDLVLDVTNETTMAIGCGVTVGSVSVTNTTDNAASLRLVGNRTDFLTTLLDFSGFNGPVTWEPYLNGASVNAGSNAVTLANGVGGTLNVASNGFVSTVGTFSTWNNAKESRIHFANKPRALNMSQLPASGVLSFDGMTVSDGGGAFQKADITYLVNTNESLTLTETGGYNARTLSSFDIRGGDVTVNPNGAWWFGQNGLTGYEQTGGTLTCNATGTTVGNSASGIVFGYTGEASFMFEVNVNGGRFLVPNGILNIWNPTTISVASNAFLKAKGIGARSGVNGILTLGEGTVFEVGSVGLTPSVSYELNGGTVAGCESGANVAGRIALGGSGGFAAAGGTTLSVTGAIVADGAALHIGGAGYDGTVRIATLPSGVTNYTVAAGTWDLGLNRPTNAVLTRLDGKIAAELTDAELRTAATDGLKLMPTTLATDDVANKVEVMRADGTAVNASGFVDHGALYLKIDWVYPLVGTVGEAGDWESCGWCDSIGVPFADDWSKVKSLTIFNDRTNAVVTLPAAFAGKVTVVNAGTLTLNGEATSPSLVTEVDDSASVGKTTLGFALNGPLAVGTFTRVTNRGTGRITVASGKTVAFGDGVPATDYSVVSGGTLRYEGERADSCYDATAGVYNNYENAFVYVPQNSGRDNDTWFKCTEGDFMRVMGGFQTATSALGWNVLVTGGEFHFATNSIGQVTWYGRNGRSFVQTGGTTVVECADLEGDGFFANYAGDKGQVTFNVSGGLFDCSTTRFKFGKANAAVVNVSGGEFKVRGFITAANPGGTVNLTGGRLSVGLTGFAANVAALNLGGGAYHAYDDSTLSGPFAVNGAVRMTAASGRTLKVTSVPTGSGSLLCGDAENTGTVLFENAGGFANVTLGGAFSIKLTSAQQSSPVDVALFKAADGLVADNVKILKADGTAAEGIGFVRDGAFRYLANDAFTLPIMATVSNDVEWSSIDWRDSSATPRKVTTQFLNFNGASSTACLYVSSNSVISCSGGASVGSLVITGEGALTLPSNLIVGGISGDGHIVCDGFCPAYAGLSDPVKWTGTVTLAGTLPKGSDLGPSGNAASTVEFAGSLPTALADRYLAVTTTVSGRFVLSGTLSSGNGNSGSVQAVFNGPFAGTGTLSMDGHGGMSSADVYKILGDARDFRGVVSVNDAKRSVTFGPHDAGEGYIYVCADNGATIASGRQWNAASGCAINVDAGGVLNVEYRADGSAATPSTVSVQPGGFLNLVRADAGQREFAITSGELKLNGGVRVNGVAIGRDRYAQSGGTITLDDAAVGAVVSVNVIGGAESIAGKTVATGQAGVVPVAAANWNQGAQKTTTDAVNVTLPNLKEVLADGSVVTGPMQVQFLAKNAYSAVGKSTTSTGDGELMFGYLDDGDRGGGAAATIVVSNIPYTTYDVYVYMGSDATTTSGSFAPVSVTAGGKAFCYPATNAGWGSAGATHGDVVLTENANYLRFTGMSGETLTVTGSKNGTVKDARCGLAGVQIFNAGTRVNGLTWKGPADGGVWNKADAAWRNAASVVGPWKELTDGTDLARFDGDTSLTLGEVVSPHSLEVNSDSRTATYGDFLPKGVDNAVVIAANARLEEVSGIAAEMRGGWIANGAGVACYEKRTDGRISVQFQMSDNQLKCAKVVLVQAGEDIKAYVEFSGYVGSGVAGSYDFDNGGYTAANTPMNDTANGYGIKDLTLTLVRGGVLTVANAQNFGAPFTVERGTLRVASGELAQSVTLAKGAMIDVRSSVITNEYRLTSGSLVNANGGLTNVLFNGSALDADVWSYANGSLTRIEQPSEAPFSVTISSSSPSPSPSPLLFTELPWVSANWFYVKPEEWTSQTVSEANLTVEEGAASENAGVLTIAADADLAITRLNVANRSNYLRLDGNDKTVAVGTLDDSASTGVTALGIAPKAVIAGAGTLLLTNGVESLTVGDGKRVAFYGTGIVDPSRTTLDGNWTLAFGDLAFTGETIKYFQKNGTFEISGPVVVPDDVICSVDTDVVGSGALALGEARLNIGAVDGDPDSPALLRAKRLTENKSTAGQVIVYPNGTLEIADAIDLNANKEFVLAGGTVRTTGATAKIVLGHVNGLQVVAPSRLEAADGTTLTVSNIVTGAGTLTVGDTNATGTVRFAQGLAEFRGDLILAGGTVELPVGTLASAVVIGTNATLNLTTASPTNAYDITSGELTFEEGASIANIRVNGEALGPTWELVDNRLVDRTLKGPFTAELAGEKGFEELAWTDINGFTLRPGEESLLTTNDLVILAQEDSVLVVSNALAVGSLAVDGTARLRFVGAGTLTSLAGVEAGGGAVVDATDASVGELDIAWPQAVTNWLVFGAATGLTLPEENLPDVPEGYSIAATADARGYVITAPKPPAKHFTVVLNDKDESRDWYEYLDFGSISNWTDGPYENGAFNTATVAIQGDIALYFERELELESLVFVGEDGGWENCRYLYIDQAESRLDKVGKIVFKDICAYSYLTNLQSDVELTDNASLSILVDAGTTEVILTTGTLSIGAGCSIYVDDYDLSSVWELNAAGNGFVKVVTGPTVTEGSGEVTDLGGGSYAVPTTVTRLSGIEPSNVVVKSVEHVVTGVFAISSDGKGGVTIALSDDPEAKVVIGGEDIRLVPELGTVAGDDHVAEVPFVVGTSNAAVGVKSIPGLKYSLVRGSSPTMTDGASVQTKTAEGTRLKLEDSAKPQGRAFYRILVER